MAAYEAELSTRLDPTAAGLHRLFEQVRAAPRRVVFAEGEEEKSIRAALSFHNAGFGTPVLIGHADRIRDAVAGLGLTLPAGIEVRSMSADSHPRYAAFLYERLQRRGALERDCQRLVNRDRNTFAACMVATGDADAMVTGLTRNYHSVLNHITRVVGAAEGRRVLGLSMILARERTLFVADTAVHQSPSAEELADFAEQAAAETRRLGHEPRVALVSFANFGNPDIARGEIVRRAVEILDGRRVGFEYDGEMGVDVALDPELRARYPFCRLTGPANILIMPGLHSADISTKLLHGMGGQSVIGPKLLGLAKPVQILPMGATVSTMVTMAAIAAHDAVA
ncbi:MAG: hypothetical protein MJD61_04110 [Proteobacteria bacterium]|nr:hypothetical protein [Pseudomonadota bacterium]